MIHLSEIQHLKVKQGPVIDLNMCEHCQVAIPIDGPHICKGDYQTLGEALEALEKAEGKEDETIWADPEDTNFAAAMLLDEVHILFKDMVGVRLPADIRSRLMKLDTDISSWLTEWLADYENEVKG